MEYQGIVNYVVKDNKLPVVNSDNVMTHILALKGLVAYFESGGCSKERSQQLKKVLEEKFCEAEAEEQIGNANLNEATEIQNKIRQAILLGVDNPWVLLIQSAKCISILLNDGDFFYDQVRRDCYAIYGDAYGDQKTKEAERKDLEASIQKLEKCITETKDKGTKHLLSRAVSLQKQRVEYLIEQDKRAKQTKLF